MSDKYILRSGAIDAIKRNSGTLYTREAEFLLQKVIFLLKNAPAADVVEVVRCRDCAKHYVVLGRDMCAKNASGSGDHLIGLSATMPDAFCGRGVRKDGGENHVSG